MGDALLLQWRRFVELVLQLSLCASSVRYGCIYPSISNDCYIFLDLKGVGEMSFSFELGKPFQPFEQLMGVMPAASKELLPMAYQVRRQHILLFSLLMNEKELMWDPNSPILDFYPQEFEQDLNGKKQDWEAVVKIPFIDEKRLLRAMQGQY